MLLAAKDFCDLSEERRFTGCSLALMIVIITSYSSLLPKNNVIYNVTVKVIEKQ